MDTNADVYLIPSFLDENAIHVIPGYVIDAIKKCQVFFAENQRSSRRFLKSIWKEMVIDEYEWFTIHKAEADIKNEFIKKLREGKTIGILSEAGCPGVADPGQILVSVAHEQNVVVKPLVGPSAILLALMASGMNGQQFQFVGYLPIEPAERIKRIRELESESLRKNCTQIFIETPYRNNQLIETICKAANPDTRLCIAADITGPGESIRTKKVTDWKKQMPDLDKRPAIFLLFSP
jgi:16S rRNA (cytidine1402-2'-O)-methyltransferase